MKKERLLFWILGLVFVGYVVVEHYSPKPLNWTVTFSQYDKNPFGSYILYDRLEDLFHGDNKVSHQTLYELQDSSGQVIILSTEFSPSEEDISSIFKRLDSGEDLLIAAEFFSKKFLDTLEIEDRLNLRAPKVGDIFKQDSVIVDLGGEQYQYPSVLVKKLFQLPDTTSWEILASSENPVLIRQSIGEGHLILCSTPLIFTNYGLLHNMNYPLAEAVLLHLGDRPLIYNRFYHSGRMESRSPFRYLLTQNAFRWALYLTIAAIMILLIFGSQRKQRMIPLLDPNENTTINYIRTIGGLYYREKNHKSAAQKLIHYFLRTLSEKYYMSSFFTEESYKTLSVKTGLKKEQVVETFDLIRNIRSSDRITEDTLKKLHEKITSFNIS